MIHLAYLSLGSNLGEREENLRLAIVSLRELGRVVAVSSMYETEPVEMTAQPLFLNCAVTLETTLSPLQLIEAVLQIERRRGRQRTQEKGPRTLDIDILLFDDLILNAPDLSIPHPAMHQRRFVLEPLVEIAPEAWHPGLNKSAWQLLEDLPEGQFVRRLTPSNNQQSKTNDRAKAE